jgi:biopolymer transport protein ExbD
MAKNQQFIKLFLSLFFCTLVIFSSSYFGAKAFGGSKKENVQQTASVKKSEKPATEPVTSKQEIVLNSATMNVKKVPDELQSFLSANPKIELPADSSFSFLDFLKKQKLETTSAEALSVIGTGIYQAILPTNFTIEERNIGSELPAYAALGDEAKVDYTQSMDLAFSNPNNSKCTLELQLNGNSLTVTLKGAKLPNEYKITKKNEQKVTPKTVVQYSPLLTSGQTTVKSPGKNGQTVEVYRQTYKGDILEKSELIANDYYPPEYRVEIHALDQPAQTAGAAADTSTQTDQQATSNTDQSSQTAQSTTDGTTTSTNGTTATSTSDSDLWGKPNEEIK